MENGATVNWRIPGRSKNGARPWFRITDRCKVSAGLLLDVKGFPGGKNMQGVAILGWRTFRRFGALIAALTIAGVLPAFAQIRPRPPSRDVVKDPRGRSIPGATVTRDQYRRSRSRTTVTDGERVLHVHEPAARTIRHHRGARGFQKDVAAERCSSTPTGHSHWTLRWRPGR